MIIAAGKGQAAKSSVPSDVLELGKQILKKQGTDFETWREAELNKRKLAVLSGTDKKWEDDTISEALAALIVRTYPT